MTNNLFPIAKKSLNTLILIVLALPISCKKFIEIDAPKTQLTSSSVFTSDAGATSAVIGIYSNIMSTTNVFASGVITLYTGLSSDEFSDFSSSNEREEFFNNALTRANGLIKGLWSEGYNIIYAANSIIERLKNSSGISPAVKKQLEGEAKFIRAFCHFYLVNLYGDIPIVTTTDYQINATIARSPASQVFQQIISDLIDAQNLLANDYSFSNGERVRPNKWSATALLARAYLYIDDWANAEVQATTVINASTLYTLVADLNSVFLKNSGESILQFRPVRGNVNTTEGELFILNSTPGNVALTNQAINAFETGDTRKSSWTNSIIIGTTTYYYPYKYKIKTGSALTEYYTVLRLAEQYLIRAEANAQQNSISSGIADLNLLRNRAGLSNLSPALTQAQLLSAIAKERRTELFCEWGHRWFDLKRTATADIILQSLKGTNWQTTDNLYPIPQAQIQNDPNITQNPGY